MMPTMRASRACWANYQRLITLARLRAKWADEDRRRKAAEAGGFFWTDCPKCGELFGGNEASGGGVYLSHDAKSARMTCKNCPGEWVATFEPRRVTP